MRHRAGGIALLCVKNAIAQRAWTMAKFCSTFTIFLIIPCEKTLKLHYFFSTIAEGGEF